jgi:hypothetical protein
VIHFERPLKASRVQADTISGFKLLATCAPISKERSREPDRLSPLRL